MLDPKEEREYEELRKMGQRLHIPIPEAFWTLEVFNKDGKLIQKHEQRSHSWVRNAYNCMFSHLAGKDISDNTFGAGKLSIKDTSGTTRFGAGQPPMAASASISVDGLTSVLNSGGYRAPAAINTHGIQVGSGVNVESFEDFVLQTLIGEGAGAGQLNYAAAQAHSISYVGLVLKNTLVRYLNNNSGGDVSVNEVALTCVGWAASVGALRLWVMSRDHLGATVTVPNTGQLKVTYIVQLTYPA